MLQGSWHVNAIFCVDTGFRITRGNHPGAVLRNQSSNVCTSIAKPMDRDSRSLKTHPLYATGFTKCIKTTTRGCFATSERASERYRLAGNNSEFGVTAHH